MVRCRYCDKRCSYIGDQPGALQRFGRRMELWNCSECGTTISRLRAPRPANLTHSRWRAIGARSRRISVFRLHVIKGRRLPGMAL
jgi:hypothetical protein